MTSSQFHAAPVDSDALSFLRALSGAIDGEVMTDSLHRVLYATDSSAYRELPMGVVVPDGEADLRRIVSEAGKHHIPLITRGAGTSLAGQVVGNGVVVDMRRFDKILSFDRDKKRVTVQPGVIRNVLNDWLAPHGLQFGPETSTASRAVIGGMIGNNSCGIHSLVYGSTRDHLVSCRAILADGSEAVFEALSPEAFHQKRQTAVARRACLRDALQDAQRPQDAKGTRRRLSQALHPAAQ